MEDDRPDVPITKEEEDRLERLPFVRRLVPALIRPDGTASGAVIGITGEWGSGKSSVLNLLEQRLAVDYPSAVVVRFDPWLVSARDDVIAAFFSAFIDAIKEKLGVPAIYNTVRDQAIDKTIDSVARYGGELTPLLNVAAPGLSVVGKLLVKGAEQVIKNRTGLRRQKGRMASALRELGHPIIVMVDELDRVEDSEIRVMAQVVRSIADFREVSYVLAYDEQRVVEALGADSPDPAKRTERGQAYLEKIVHQQISLPLLLPEELRALLIADFDKHLELLRVRLETHADLARRRVSSMTEAA